MKKLYLILIILISFCTACKKSGSVSNSSPGGNTGTGGNATGSAGSSNYIKTITSIPYDSVSGSPTDSIVVNIVYDAHNRAVSQTSLQYDRGPSNPDIPDTLLAAYTSNTITVTQHIWESGVLQQNYVTTYYLDPSGSHLADSAFAIAVISASPHPDTSKTTYAYDANGYLISAQEVSLINGKAELLSSFNYTVSNGNTVSWTQRYYTTPGDTSNSILLTNLVTFTSQINGVANVTGNGNNFGGLLDGGLAGHANVNIASIYALIGSPSLYYNTILDGQGRISSVTEKSASGKLLYLSRYTYY